MFYRLSGVHHNSYISDTRIYKIPADRHLALFFLALGLAAPFLFGSLYLNNFILP